MMEPDGSNVRQGAQIRRLHILRLMIGPTGFGMMVAAGITSIIGVARFLTGHGGSLGSILPMFLMAAFFVGAAAVAIPRIDRRILELARSTTGDSAGLEMLRIVNGLPLFAQKAEIQREVARQLSEVDAPWWERNAKDLREQVHAAFETASHGGLFRQSDGPWLPALLHTIARCGRTEYIRPIEGLLRRAGRGGISEGVVKAANESLESLLIRQKHNKEQATLLRPSRSIDSPLLRPAEGQTSNDESNLLRPTTIMNPASASTKPGIASDDCLLERAGDENRPASTVSQNLN